MNAFTFANVAIILTIHWLADFCLQTEPQASNKSKSWAALFSHVGTYTLALLLAFGTHSVGWILWGVFNGGCHLAVDAATSRLTSKLYSQGRNHDFFAVIGADQLIHTAILLGTFSLMTPKG